MTLAASGMVSSSPAMSKAMPMNLSGSAKTIATIAAMSSTAIICTVVVDDSGIITARPSSVFCVLQLTMFSMK